MRPPFYLRQLRRDLEDWIAKGLVPAASRDAILASVGSGTRTRLDLIFAVLGVILIGAGAMSFVAANWQEMSKLTRLIVLFGTMWAAYAIAIYFLGRTRDIVGVDLSKPALAGQLLGGVPQHAMDRRADVENSPVGRDHGDHVRAMLDQGPEPRVASWVATNRRR